LDQELSRPGLWLDPGLSRLGLRLDQGLPLSEAHA